MAKNEDISTSVDLETRDLVRGNRAPQKPTPASGDKFIQQMDRFISSSRDGKSTK